MNSCRGWLRARGATRLSELTEIRGDGIEKTVLYLPPAGGAWFGPPLAAEGRPAQQQQYHLRPIFPTVIQQYAERTVIDHTNCQLLLVLIG
jgi:hypothetical protein